MSKIIGYLLALVGLEQGERIFEVLHFFIYDTIKLIMILMFMVFIISFIRSFFPPEKVREKLNKYGDIRGNILASMLGVVTPFCSCSSVPIFIGFIETGVSLGVTFSFLITSPLINEAAFGILVGAFGIKIASLYMAVGVIIGVLGGWIIGKFKLEKYVEGFVYEVVHQKIEVKEMKLKDRVVYAKDEMFKIVKKIYMFIIFGILIGAFIHGYANEEFVIKIIGEKNMLAVPIAVIMGVPMYAGAIGTIPIAKSLILKGAGTGTALAFMMAVTALSLPEMIMLKKIMKYKLLAIFITITTISIIFVGYMFNYIL